jgi:hypothetical protein
MVGDRLSRRRVLAVTTAVGIGSIAGCGSGEQGPGDGETTDPVRTGQPSTAETDSPGSAERNSAVVHVSVEGSESNPGTEANPLGSIQAGIDQAGPGETVYVHPGEYHENVRIRAGGEPTAPLTLTGPPEAVLKPKPGNEWEALGVGASHVHVTGLSFSGLHDPDAPANAESYARTHLIYLNTNPTETGYLEGLVISPHRIGHAGGALINSMRIKDAAIGGFTVTGPAGARWLFSERDGHYGEIVYLGTATDNLTERGEFEEYDHTRNVRVHHIDNSGGHPHSELVDCKEGTRNITIEYCTDAGGVQSDDSYWSQAISLNGRDCTVRWNIIRNAMGSAVGIGPWGFLSDPTHLAEPQTEKERRMGTNHAVYGNVFTGNSADAIDFLRESWAPDRESNPLPADQRALCGNLYDGYSDAALATACPSDVPTGERVGHLAGDSPWSGTPPEREAVFTRSASFQHVEFSVSAEDVASGEQIAATVTITNTAERAKELTVGIRDRGYLLTEQTVTVTAGETRDVRCSAGGIEPTELAVTLDGKKIGRIRVLDET